MARTLHNIMHINFAIGIEALQNQSTASAVPKLTNYENNVAVPH